MMIGGQTRKKTTSPNRHRDHAPEQSASSLLTSTRMAQAIVLAMQTPDYKPRKETPTNEDQDNEETEKVPPVLRTSTTPRRSLEEWLIFTPNRWRTGNVYEW
jgi:hypothetical protein